MTDLLKKTKVLVFILNYLPGYKSGGVLRTIVNTVVWLRDDCEFWIVTRDRDLGDDKPYSEIKINEWQHIEGAMVHYLSPDLVTTTNLIKLIAETQHDFIHLNSYFDPIFTLRILLARKIGWLPKTPLVLSPRGEFGDGSLKLKYIKKILFIKISKLVGLFNDLTWHATSKFELQDIVEVLNLDTEAVKMALDLPSKIIPDTPNNASLSGNTLRMVFLSRISREKNLDFALRILQKVNATVIFDIYGPDEDSAYWKECQEIIKKLSKNISVSYQGPVSPNKVAEIFSGYDLFFFPSKGENYGHVIAESISVGTRILLSKNTPWQNLEYDGLGWDVDLKEESVFVNIIEKLAAQSRDAWLGKRAMVKEGALKRLLDPMVVNDNRKLFRITS